MEKIKSCLLLVFGLAIILKSEAQDKPIIRPGLIRAQLTISPSVMLSGKESPFYLHGNLEGYLSSRLSLSGEAYYHMGNTSSGKTVFDYNHSAFFGTAWHFTGGSNDLYIGLHPGLSFTRISKEENNFAPVHNGVNPLFSAVLGYNFYANKIFHFFIQTRFVTGQHNYDIHKDLSELRLSAGLGFNINTLK